jgi:acetyl esterase/lipase
VADPYAETAHSIGKTPVWIFHGDADPAVPVEESYKMYAALQAANANVKYTEYPGVGHEPWNNAYGRTRPGSMAAGAAFSALAGATKTTHQPCLSKIRKDKDGAPQNQWLNAGAPGSTGEPDCALLLYSA